MVNHFDGNGKKTAETLYIGFQEFRLVRIDEGCVLDLKFCERNGCEQN
jgi:hypothetical protein